MKEKSSGKLSSPESRKLPLLRLNQTKPPPLVFARLRVTAGFGCASCLQHSGKTCSFLALLFAAPFVPLARLRGVASRQPSL